MDKVRSKLASLDKTKKGKKVPTERDELIKKYIWKPQPGKQVVRIVPYQFQPDFPFIELKWHYGLNGDGNNYLSPASINEPDPIVELANRLEKVKETWLKGRKMQPKVRTYVPIIVRGEEEKGVRFWGFGVQVFNQLMETLNEPEYGDITDLNNGRDITVDFKTAEEVKKDYPETSILVKPTQRPAVDPNNPKCAEIMALITKGQKNILDIYQLATYDELAAALEVKLENERRGQQAAQAAVNRGGTRTAAAPPAPAEDDNVVLPTEEQIAAATAPATVAEVKAAPAPTAAPAQTVSPSAAKAKVNVDDLTKAFENIFPESKR